MTREQIVKILQKHLVSQMEKHRMNAEIMISNPMAIHDHTSWTEGIENELAKMAEYHDKHEMVSKFFDHHLQHGHKHQREK
tara:strand:+ start:142 stop:384 length:243 start_codon:yes stop_codon:yes gene_type:complete